MDVRASDPGRSRRLLHLTVATVALLLAVFAHAQTARAFSPEPPGGTYQSEVWSNSTPEDIPDNNTAGLERKFVVSGMGTFLGSLDVYTAISHTRTGDLTVTLTSPAGTTVRMSRTRGGDADDLFANTLWSDEADDSVTNAAFVSGTAELNLSPVQPFARFYGEDPNGTWTLKIVDSGEDDIGSLNESALVMDTLALPATITQQPSVTQAAPIPLAAGATATTVQTFNVSGIAAGTVWDVDLYQSVIADRNGLKIELESPAGTKVLLNQETGTGLIGGAAYSDMTWSDTGTDPIKDTNLVTTSSKSFSPQQALARFRGENPNGAWKLTITGGNPNGFAGAELSTSRLDIATATTPSALAAPTGCAPVTKAFTFNIPDSAGAVPRVPAPDVELKTGSLIVKGTVAGLPTSLYDIKVLTPVLYDKDPADLRMMLVAPNGQTVWLKRGRGTGSGDIGYALKGAVWDDDAGAINAPGSLAETPLKASGTAPLAPLQSLSTLVGVNPNGEWELRMVDKNADPTKYTVIRKWSLLVTATNQTPALTKTTAQPGLVDTLPAGATKQFSMTIANAGTVIGDVNTRYISQNPARFVTATLISPSGTRVTLATPTGASWGSSSQAFDNVVFDDSASQNVLGVATTGDDTAPTVTDGSSLAPAEPLGAFRGENPNGTWKLEVKNSGTTESRIDGWAMEIRNAACSDKTPPVNPTLSSSTHTVDVPSTDDVITADFSGATDADSAVSGFSYLFDTNATTTPDTTIDADDTATAATSDTLADGTYYFHLRTRDTKGNWSEAVHLGPFKIDTTAPDTTIATGPTGTTGLTQPEFTFTSDDSPVTYECALDLGAYVACTTPYTPATALTAGAHTLSVRATDAVGHTDASPATRSFTVDTTFPDTSIDTGPSGLTKNATPAWTFSSTKSGATFACSLDGAAYAACTSPYTASALISGSHTFAVRATDAAGNTDATPATRAITVDAVAPDTSFTSGPNGPTKVTSPSFNLSADEGSVTYECKLDTGAFAACGSPYTVGPLGEGSHTVQVRATDLAGNVDATPASRTFTVDVTAPDTTLPGAPTGTITTATPSLTLASSEGSSTFECKVDTGAYAACTSPWVTPTLGEGPHTIAVRATDPAGNTDATPATATFTVDTVAPDTTLGATPTGTVAASPAFTFTSPDVTATFQCSVDSGTYTACTSPKTLGPLSGGSHRIDVRAVDPAGNVDPTPAGRAFTVDATAPETTLVNPVSGTIATATPTFTFTSDDVAATFECSVDSTTVYAACTSPKTTATLSEGNHTFRVRATDAAGNVDPTVASAGFTVDTVAPDTTITSGPTSLTASGSPSLTFTSDEAGATFRCAIDSTTDYATCTSPYAPSLDDGQHTIRVRAVDAGGNVDGSPAARTFTVDTTAPETIIDSGPSGASGPSPQFAFSSPEPGTTFSCSLDDAALYHPCVSPEAFSNLADGSHTFRVRATDLAGNVDATPAVRTIAVESSVPVPAIDGTVAAGGYTNTTTPTFTLSSSKDGSSFKCAIDGGAFVSCGSPFTTPNLAEGTRTLLVRAYDAVGNESTVVAGRTFTVDVTAPDTSITAGPPESTVTTVPSFDFTAGEAGATYECAIDTGDFAACRSPFATPTLSVGAHRFQVRAIDLAGNRDSSPASRGVTILAPPAPTPAPAAAATGTGTGATGTTGTGQVATASTLSAADRSIALKTGSKPALRVGAMPVTASPTAVTLTLVCPAGKQCAGTASLSAVGGPSLKLKKWTGKISAKSTVILRWKLTSSAAAAIKGKTTVKFKVVVKLGRKGGKSATVTRTFTVPVTAATATARGARALLASG